MRQGALIHIQEAYTCLGISSMQILLLSAHACMHFARELRLDTQCIHLVYALMANCNQNAYMHEQPTKELWQEVPKLVYAFWTCKPMYSLLQPLLPICWISKLHH